MTGNRLRKGIVGIMVLGIPIAVADPFVTPGLALQPTPTGSGARALGQGNAFIAVADDATAASWNPGGLSQLEAFEISFAVDANRLRTSQNWLGHPEAETDTTVRLQDLNYFSVAWPLRLGNNHAVASLNWLKQYQFNRSLTYRLIEDPTPTIHSEKDRQERGSGSLAALTPALAVDIGSGLSLGAALNIWNDDITGAGTFRFREEGWLTSTRRMPNNTIRVTREHTLWEDEFSVDEGYSLTLGVYYRLNRAWSFGLVLKPPYTLDLQHDAMTLKEGTNFPAGPQVTRRSAGGHLYMPWVVGAGAACRFSDAFTIALDVQWTQWSTYRYKEGGESVNPLNGLPHNQYQAGDTIAVRTGLEYVIINDNSLIPLRCGFGYEQTPTLVGSDEYCSATLGGGYQIGRYMFDVAYELRNGTNLAGKTRGSVANKTFDELGQRLMLSLIVYF